MKDEAIQIIEEGQLLLLECQNQLLETIIRYNIIVDGISEAAIRALIDQDTDSMEE